MLWLAWEALTRVSMNARAMGGVCGGICEVSLDGEALGRLRAHGAVTRLSSFSMFRPFFSALPLWLALVLPLFATLKAAESTLPNPLIRQRADPFIARHTDGFYYFMGTVPEYDRLELRRATTLEGLATAEAKTIWRKHETGPMGAHIWAPELHFIQGKWYVYFAAGAADKIWDIRIYVLENASPNPLEGTWEERGQLKTNWESFSLDATTFEHRGIRYLLWAQKAVGAKTNSNLYIAKMDTPTSIAGAQTLLSEPEFDWEKIRYAVNEGPAVLVRHGRVFVTYSAAGTGAEYCLGLLSADENADLLDAKSLTKS